MHCSSVIIYLFLSCRKTQVGGICFKGPLQCFSSATGMAWLAALYNWSHRRWGKERAFITQNTYIHKYIINNYIYDLGLQLLMLKPKRYGLDHKENFSGEGDEYIYHSKGHTLNPGQRDWTRYQSWQPTKTQ